MAAAMKATKTVKAMKTKKPLTWTKKWSGRHEGPYVMWTLASVTIHKRTLVVTEIWTALPINQDLTAMRVKTAMKAMKAMKAKK
jgi:hypothetical protein